MAPEFKLEGEGVDTAALEEELSRRVADRRRAGVYTHEVEAALAERLPEEEDPSSLPPIAALDYAATRAGASWEVSAAYPVETEKRLIRPLVIFAKRIARVWARVAVGPIQREQTAFNRHVACALEALKRQAVAERAEALADEADLAALAGAMVAGDEAEAMAGAVSDALADAHAVTAVGPCHPGLLEALEADGRSVHRVSPPTSWDTGGPSTGTGPEAFLSQAAERSIGAVLVCELAFWLRPEALIRIARRSYLALEAGGRAVFAVHGFAAGAPAPAWCSPEVVAAAMELAGFIDIAPTVLESGGPPGFVVSAGKR